MNYKLLFVYGSFLTLGLTLVSNSLPFQPLVASATTQQGIPHSAGLADNAIASTTPTSDVNAQIYRDRTGQFSVPIPTNWTAENEETYGLLTDPDGKISIYVLVVKGDDVRAAVLESWETVDPNTTNEVTSSQELASTGGTEKAVQFTFKTTDAQQTKKAIAKLYRGTVYITLIKADLQASIRREAQINIITSGFNITDIKMTDLSGVKPLIVDDQITAQLEAYITENIAKLSIPGAEVAIVQDGKIVYAKGFGVRQLGSTEPVTPKTLMMIGSITKTMTSMMMATVVDDRFMSWDTPAISIMPQFAVSDPNLTKTITVSNLVCNCTGVSQHDFELIFLGNKLTAQDVVKSLSTFQMYTKFGEAYQYSNQMVAMGGYVAAMAAGGSFDNLYNAYVANMQTRIWNPIGMTDTTMSFEKVKASGNYALPHGLNLSGKYQVLPLSMEEFVSPIAPAGAAWSNVEDMGRYAITVLQKGVAPDGRRVVSEHNLETTWQPQIPIDAQASFALGWVVTRYKGQKKLWYRGGTQGFTGQLALLPDANLGIVILSNVDNTQGALFSSAVETRLFELVFRQPNETEPIIKTALNKVQQLSTQVELAESIDTGAVTPYLGRYTNPALGEIALRLDNGKLMLAATNFESELQSPLDSNGKAIAYVIYESPLAGIAFVPGKGNAGNFTITMMGGTPDMTYTFTRLQARQ
ncbi:beta-lactamase family protein [Phormidium tenue FACHB-886]|nr:beta-lactamase family protein [Phormidium tenue FACHB-886]